MIILTGETNAGKRPLLLELFEKYKYRKVPVIWTYMGETDDDIDCDMNWDIGYSYCTPRAWVKLDKHERFEFKWSALGGDYQFGILKNTITQDVPQAMILEPEEAEEMKRKFDNVKVFYLKTPWVVRMAKRWPEDSEIDGNDFLMAAIESFYEDKRYTKMIQNADIVLLNDDDEAVETIAAKIEDVLKDHAELKIRNLRYLV